MVEDEKMKNIEENMKNEELEQSKMQDEYKSAILSAYKDFYKLTPAEQEKYSVSASLTGKEKFREQFWNYLKKKLGPKTLENIDKNLFKVYFEKISKQKFTVAELTDSEWTENLKVEKGEDYAITQTLEKFENFCNGVDPKLYSDFAKYADFDDKKHKIGASSKFKTMDQIYQVWEDFLESSAAPSMGDTSKEKAKAILEGAADSYDYTERMMVTVMINKIQNLLPSKIKTEFKKQFVLPITALSSVQSLKGFANALDSFLRANPVDEKLAKKLQELIVTNADVEEELIEQGIVTKSATEGNFSMRNIRCKTIFGNLLTAQYFKEIDATDELIKEGVFQMKDTFFGFPPYFNDILKDFPATGDELESKNPSLKKLKDDLNDFFAKLNAGDLSDDEKSEINAEIKALQKQIKEENWKAYIALVQDQDKNLGTVLQKLYLSQFDLAKLSQDEQQVLLDTLVDKKVGEKIRHQIPGIMGVGETEFQEFLKDLFDLNKKEVLLPTQDGPVKLEFLKKEFVGGPMKELPSIESLSDAKNLPLNFVVKNTAESEAFFGVDLWDPVFFDINGQRVHESYKVSLKDSSGNVLGPGYLSTYGSDGKDDTNYQFFDRPLDYPAQDRKPILDAEGNPVILSEDEIKNYQLNIQNKDLNLNGKSIGNLLFAFMMGASSVPAVKKIQNDEEVKKQLKGVENYKDIEENYPKEEQKQKKDTEAKESNEVSSDFLNKWSSLPGKAEFKEGARVLVNLGSSSLPPLHNPGPEWAWLEVKDINPRKNSFSVKVSGAHLGVGDEYEGKTIKLSMNKGSLESWEKTWGRSNLMRIPPLNEGNSYEDQLDMIKNSGVKLTNMDMLGNGMRFVGGKFEVTFQKDNPDLKGEVKYLSARKVDWMSIPVTEKDSEVLYKIKHNSDNTITVSTSFVGKEKEDKKGKKIKPRFKYEKKMDYTSFILFAAGKDLAPETEESAKPKKEKAEIDKAGNIHQRVKRFSIGNVVKSVTNSVERFKDQLSKKRQEEAEDLMDIVFSQNGMYEKIGSIIPFANISDSFTKMHYEFRKERGDRVRNRIKYWADQFTEDPHFSTVAVKYIQPRLEGKKKWVDRFQAAGAFLAMIKKGGMYNRHFAKHWVGKGNWVNIILGEDHFHRFQKVREEKKKELEHFANKHWMFAEANMDQLVDLEVRYIASVIDGREYGPGAAGGEEEKWSAYRSRQYADEIQGAYDDMKSPSKIEETANQFGNMGFDHAMHEFRRYCTSGRPFKAMPFYKKMADAIRTPQQKQLFNMATTFLVLSGFLNNWMSADVRKIIQRACRSTGFYPGIVARDSRNQEHFVALLKHATKGSFPDSLRHNIAPYPGKNFVPYDMKYFQYGKMDNADQLFDELRNWWLSGNGEMVDRFLDVRNSDFLDVLKDDSVDAKEKAMLKTIFDKGLEDDYETVDNDIKGNFFISTDNPLNFSAAFTNKLMNISGKDFQGDDREVEAMREYWKSHATAVPTHNMAGSPERISFIINKFINNFGTVFDNTKSKNLLRAIATCQNLKKSGEPQADDKIKFIFRHLIDGQVVAHYRGIPGEFRVAIEAYRNFFIENYQNINTEVILGADKSIGSDEFVDAYKDPYEFLNVKVYSAKIGRQAQDLKTSAEKERLRDDSKYLNPLIESIDSSLKSSNESVSIESDKTLWDSGFKEFLEENKLKAEDVGMEEVDSMPDFAGENKKKQDGTVHLMETLESGDKIAETTKEKKRGLSNLFGRRGGL